MKRLNSQTEKVKLTLKLSEQYCMVPATDERRGEVF